MDILTHTLSGVAVATCLASFMPTIKARLHLLWLGAFAGALPDLDAISLWQQFDQSIGAYFGLAKGSAIYVGRWWYSHHAFFHSILASLLFGCLFTLLGYGLSRLKHPRQTGLYRRHRFLSLMTFVLAYWAHLAGDLPTPSAYWGGIALFWPSQSYVGGSGQIWWWHNYDVFLLVVFCVAVNLLLLSCRKWLRQATPKLTGGVFLLALGLILYQINTRQYDYAYDQRGTNHAQMDDRAHQEQKRILGKTLYGYMLAFERQLPFYF